jgi:DNA-binding response OmpR family regulator
MKSSATHLLLIESDPADAKVIKDALHDDSAAFVVEWVKSLAEALEYLANNPIEVVLLDLALPD